MNILTDTMTNINQSIENVQMIKNDKSFLGQIIYEMDLALNNEKNIIYLTDKKNFSKIVDISISLTKIHSQSTILVIEANDNINKVSFNEDIISSLKENNLKYQIVYDDALENTALLFN